MYMESVLLQIKEQRSGFYKQQQQNIFIEVNPSVDTAPRKRTGSSLFSAMVREYQTPRKLQSEI